MYGGQYPHQAQNLRENMSGTGESRGGTLYLLHLLSSTIIGTHEDGGYTHQKQSVKNSPLLSVVDSLW